MRGCDEADVDLVSTIASQPLEFLLLQDTQQFCLKFERNVANLIQEKRALIREFKTSRLLPLRRSEMENVLIRRRAQL